MDSALRYASLLGAPVREPSALEMPRRLDELELQAHWFAGTSTRVHDDRGQPVRVVQFGV
jgi:hypothetical protein